jgi:Domain of unknown function (DUF4303)
MTMKNFDFATLEKEIITACEAAYSEISALAPNDPIQGFAIYSDSGAMTVCTSMANQSYFEEIKSEDSSDYLSYKYSPTEWTHEGVGADDLIEQLCTKLRDYVDDLDDGEFSPFKQKLMQTCLESAKKLKNSLFVDKPDDFILLVTISDDDESKKVLNSRVSQLNSPQTADEFKKWTKTW